MYSDRRVIPLLQNLQEMGVAEANGEVRFSVNTEWHTSIAVVLWGRGDNSGPGHGHGRGK